MKTRLTVLLATLALTACTAQNNASIRISELCAPPSDAKACTFAQTCEAQYGGQVAIDLGVTSKLWLLVQVDNLLPNNGDGTTYRTNTNDAFVHEAEIEFPGVGTVTTLVPGSAKVPAAGTAVISVYLVDAAVAAAARTANLVAAGGSVDVVAVVRLKGVLADTTEFKTGPFQVSVRACNNTANCTLNGLTCTTGTAVACPPNFGQSPIATACST